MSDPLGEGLGVSALPGLGPQFDQESRVFLVIDDHVVKEGVRIEADSDDDANTGKTYKLRAGMVVVRIEAGADKGKYVDVNHADAPVTASIVEAGILAHYVDMRDKDGNRGDRTAAIITHGIVDQGLVIFNTVDAPRIAALKTAMKLVRFRQALP